MIQAKNPNWKPLERLLGTDTGKLGEWEWCYAYEDAGGDIQVYRHGHTRRELLIEARSGDTYKRCAGDFAPISPEEALRRATTF